MLLNQWCHEMVACTANGNVVYILWTHAFKVWIQLHCASLDRMHTEGTQRPESNCLWWKTQMLLINVGAARAQQRAIAPAQQRQKTADFPGRRRRVNSSEDLQPSINGSGGAPLFSPHQQRRNRLRLNGVDTAHVGWATYTLTHHFIVQTSLKPLGWGFFCVCLFVSVSFLFEGAWFSCQGGWWLLLKPCFCLAKKKAPHSQLLVWKKQSQM